MWDYIIFFTLTPVIEWGIHFSLHYFDNNNHSNHHVDVYKTGYKNFSTVHELEILPPVVIVLSFYFKYWFVFIFLSRYWVSHTAIHYSDCGINYFQDLKIHHLNHHKFKSYNFSVSGIYPDIIFGTYKKDPRIFRKNNIYGYI